MIRIRTGGVIDTDAALGLADIADEFARGWIHLTTRQQAQLHHVEARNVTTVLSRLASLGLVTRSACGHTMRGVMWCPEAGVGLEEPFDCSYDAKAAQDSILRRTPQLDTQMPQRINIAFGGCTACRENARVNDMGFVSKVNPDGDLGYELWLGGSLGKSSPTLAFKAVDFLPRKDVQAAVNALFDVFITHGDFDQPAKARLKFLIRRLGQEQFLSLFQEQFAEARAGMVGAPQALPPAVILHRIDPGPSARGWLGKRGQASAGSRLGHGDCERSAGRRRHGGLADHDHPGVRPGR